ncbi:MAG: GTPase HflX [Pseudomonadota bacterium]
MKTLYGNTGGLKASQLRRLENIYRRRIPPAFLVTPELTRDLSELSHEIRRQIGLLINRQGRVAFVIVGDPQGIVIPDTEDYRNAPGRLRGLRCVHTHLKKEEVLSRDDLTDLAQLGLDLMAVVTLTEEGLPHKIHIGHILPGASAKLPCHILPPIAPHQLDIDCLEMIQALERELSQTGEVRHAVDGRERALLVSVSTGSKREALDSLRELEELSLSCGIEVVATQLQQRSQADARYLMGRGKLQELSILAMQKGVSLLVFDQELNPSQIRSIAELIDLKVIDRTQLILDIFAQRAQTREGKRQVELAQLRYLLPRLVTKNTAMSRLTGGIGGRGPGETKLEINRRRVRERITRLEKDLGLVRKQRHQRRSRRDRRGTPVISIIGYTNAGKSTLLNTLTDSHVLAESRLFATLDPTSRRLRFPRDTEVIITDTVGFIRDLPKELRVAFRATLEELESADLLLHVVDVSNPRFEVHMASVEKVLEDLELLQLPRLEVFNKADLVDPEQLPGLKGRLDGVFISALSAETLIPLIEKMEQMVHHRDDAP